jgi:hypothetical protein
MKWMMLFPYLFLMRCEHPKQQSIHGAQQTRNTAATSGLVEYTSKMLDTIWTDSTKPVWAVPVKIWYLDSMAIEENASLNFITDSNNKTTIRIDILNYRFNDFRNKTIYVYGSFSDTATMIKKYSFNDTTVRIVGGWGFNHKREHDYIEGPQSMTDTTIEKVTYQRIRLKREREGHIYFTQLYFRCDSPTSLFTFDTRLSNKTGCPCVKFYSEFSNNRNVYSLREIEFIRDSLTNNELNVFKVWEQNARK